MRSLFIICCLLPGFVKAQEYSFETRDIDNFWTAYDMLYSAEDFEDSVNIIQTHYIDNATDGLKEFINLRNFTAEEYVIKLAQYPKFWKSVRPLTVSIVDSKPIIDSIFTTYSSLLPDYQQPDICFAIGCLRTGGTTRDNLILIGAEIAAADTTVDKSEMDGWLSSIIGNTGNIESMIAHETIHIQQFSHFFIRFSSQPLLTQAILEGVADYIPKKFLDLEINSAVYDYGQNHECSLWNEFRADIQNNSKNYKNWLYKGNQQGKPADLGYFMGYKIAEAYYENEEKKQKALKWLLDPRKYKKLYRKSDYNEKACNNP